MARWIEEARIAEDKRPLWTFQDIVGDISAGRAILLEGQRSAVVLTVTDFPGAGERIAEAWLAGGDLDEIRDAIPQMEAWAREARCTQAHVTGRKGWIRALAPHGYEHFSVTVRKLLT